MHFWMHKRYHRRHLTERRVFDKCCDWACFWPVSDRRRLRGCPLLGGFASSYPHFKVWLDDQGRKNGAPGRDAAQTVHSLRRRLVALIAVACRGRPAGCLVATWPAYSFMNRCKSGERAIGVAEHTRSHQQNPSSSPSGGRA